MAKKINGIEVPEICSGYFEYKMSKTMADAIIRSTKEKKNTHRSVCSFSFSN